MQSWQRVLIFKYKYTFRRAYKFPPFHHRYPFISDNVIIFYFDTRFQPIFDYTEYSIRVSVQCNRTKWAFGNLK